MRIIWTFLLTLVWAGIGHAAPLQLNWTDNANNEIGFTIERKLAGESSFSVLDEVDTNITTYADSTAPIGTAATYRVSAFNMCCTGASCTPVRCDSAFSNEATATAQSTAVGEVTLVCAFDPIDDPDDPNEPPVVTDVQTASGRTYGVWPDLQHGTMMYEGLNHGNYNYGVIPQEFLGKTTIRTAHPDRAHAGTDGWMLKFTVDRDTSVVVGHHAQIATKPAWLDGWELLDDEIFSTANTGYTPAEYQLFRKSFTAGEIVLGPNGGTSSDRHYLVILE